jgi:probable F420-dependent oxidoreductase
VRLGYFLPQLGPAAGPGAITDVAKKAEELGFDSLWVTERSLVPLHPKVPYPEGDGSLPEAYRISLDPLDALTYAAAQTTRIALGTSVLNLPWYSPILLARRLTTLDVLSQGRLRVGLGLGWSPDEYQVAGTAWSDRAARYEEAILLLKTVWTTNPVEFAGSYYKVPTSFIGPKPVQKPHPPLYMAAFVPAAMARVARLADGWHPSGFPIAQLAPTFAKIQAMAAEAGRDPESLELIVRAGVGVNDGPTGENRTDYSGSPEQIAEDIAATRDAGAAEIALDVTFDPRVRSAADFLERLELLASLTKQLGLRRSTLARPQ